MSIFIHSSGETKSIINGDVLTDKSFVANYDGKNMKITGHNNDNKFNVKMTNDDIIELLSKPSSKLTLKQRLMNDYNVKSSTTHTKSTKKRGNKGHKKTIKNKQRKNKRK